MNKKIAKLRSFNIKMAVLHGIQAVAMLALANDFSVGVTASYLTFVEETESLEPTSRVLFDVRFVYLVVAFLAMSSIAHTIMATIGRKKYEKDLKKGINVFRWFEYSLSASTMMVAISMLTGVYDLASLIMIFGLTAVMNLMGLVMEVHNQTTKKLSWLSYNIGVLAGILPWIAVALYFWASGSDAGGGPPTFVYFIFGTIFLFFNTFAINMVLQYKQIGKWSDYLYGERAYIVLSLLAKTALAWQVYAGTLQPS